MGWKREEWDEEREVGIGRKGWRKESKGFEKISW